VGGVNGRFSLRQLFASVTLLALGLGAGRVSFHIAREDLLQASIPFVCGSALLGAGTGCLANRTVDGAIYGLIVGTLALMPFCFFQQF
jgi:hypothetical protein